LAAGAVDAATEGDAEAATRAKLANAASKVLELAGLSLISTSSVLARSDMCKRSIIRKAMKWFHDRGNLPRFERL